MMEDSSMFKKVKKKHVAIIVIPLKNISSKSVTTLVSYKDWNHEIRAEKYRFFKNRHNFKCYPSEEAFHKLHLITPYPSGFYFLHTLTVVF